VEWMERKLKITGMHCLDCATKVQQALASVPGVRRAQVQYIRRMATVETEEDVPLQLLVEAVRQAGYGAEPS
jgi:Cu+-exporting ATPase